jgi:hypothetical protein
MSTNENAAQSAKGIDFHQALSILSQRSAGASHHAHEHGDHNACPCQAPPAAATEAVQKMGQVIHLDGGGSGINDDADDTTASSNRTTGDKGTATSSSLTDSSGPSSAASRSLQPNPQFIEAFRSLSTLQLLQAVLSAQQDRVAAYRDYNKGLQAVLATNHVGYYPTVCTEATAKFAIVGDTIQAVHATLDERNGTTTTNDKNVSLRKETQRLVRTLQQYEKQKLQYTAALHLEQIRLHQTSEDDHTSRKLLEDSTRTLHQKLTACISEINDVLEEIQCTLLDAPNDDMDGDESKQPS